MSGKLYTIGHSAAEFSTFLAMLKKWEVSLVVDVRSRPHSARFPHFDQVPLQRALQEAKVRYLFLGEELGGRPDDPKAYAAGGVVDYRARRGSYAFQAGMERVMQELEQHELALMCAEEDPLNCHRFLMICPELVALGCEPQHIRKGGALESQREAEDRLLRAQRMGSVAGASLFAEERSTALEEAYLKQSQEFAFRADPAEMESWQ